MRVQPVDVKTTLRSFSTTDINAAVNPLRIEPHSEALPAFPRRVERLVVCDFSQCFTSSSATPRLVSYQCLKPRAHSMIFLSLSVTSEKSALTWFAKSLRRLEMRINGCNASKITFGTSGSGSGKFSNILHAYRYVWPSSFMEFQ